MISSSNGSTSEYDVIICGGGFTGQTLARQLKLTHPDVSFVILEKAALPLEEGQHKVGESTIDPSSYYLTDMLQLEEYMRERHVLKLGFRFFWQGNGDGCFSERPEVGLSEHYFDSYQIDRARFESDLYRMNVDMGVPMIDQVSISDIVLNDTDLHEVHYKHPSSKENQVLRGRWVVDAMGRRGFLQKKLGLRIKSTKPHSSAWFHVRGRLDVSDLVPASNKEWHERVRIDEGRYTSTNHLMGTGYFIWLIPLPSGYTSIGIVTSEEFHPFTTYSTLDRAIAWLEKYEPMLGEKVQEYEIVDFLKLRNYTYTSRQVFSEKRWACVGDAAVFSDPLFSVGMEYVAYGNTCVTHMVGLDRQGELTPEHVASYNDFVITANNNVTTAIQDLYPYMGNSRYMALRFILNITSAVGSVGYPIRNSIYLDPDKSKQASEMLTENFQLIGVINKIMVEWATKCNRPSKFSYIDYYGDVPFLLDLVNRNSREYSSFEDVQENYRYGLRRLEEVAQAVFVLMLEELMPEKLDTFPEPLWLNAWALSFEPDKWEEDGLFEPTTEPRDLTDIIHQLRALQIFEGRKELVA